MFLRITMSASSARMLVMVVILQSDVDPEVDNRIDTNASRLCTLDSF